MQAVDTLVLDRHRVGGFVCTVDLRCADDHEIAAERRSDVVGTAFFELTEAYAVNTSEKRACNADAQNCSPLACRVHRCKSWA